MKLATFVLALALPFAATAQIPEAVLPQGVGVNIHFTSGHEHDLDLIAAAGIKFVRMDFTWTAIENDQGKYYWGDYDTLTADLEKRGLRAIYILDYTHHLYETNVDSLHPITGKPHRTTASPQHPESIAAFTRWVAAAAHHFAGHKILWEIWNEPNGHFWAPHPDPTQYATLALATSKTIRAADPHATIVGPAVAGFAWDFLETVFKSGALEYFDAVTVHPYRDPSQCPETAAPDYAKLRELINRYAPKDRQQEIPILSGEWGYSTYAKGVSLETQAAFAARQQLFNLLHHVPLSIWYDWKNDGEDPKENEHNFGTVFPDLKPKPAYLALQTLTRELNGYHIDSRLTLTNAADYVLLLRQTISDPDHPPKLAAWTTGKPHPVTIAPGASLGASKPLTLDLTPMPQYITLSNPPPSRPLPH